MSNGISKEAARTELKRRATVELQRRRSTVAQPASVEPGFDSQSPIAKRPPGQLTPNRPGVQSVIRTLSTVPRKPKSPIPNPPWLTAMGIAGAGTGEGLVNLGKRLANIAVTGGDVMGVGVQPPFKEETGMQELAAGMRPMQSLPQNIVSDALGLSPYMLPGVGQALFGAELASQPQHIPEMVKSVGQSYWDVIQAAHPMLNITPGAIEAKERIRQQPLGTAMNVMLPAMLATGAAKAGKIKAALTPKPKAPRVKTEPAIIGKGKVGEEILIQRGLEATKPKPEPMIPIKPKTGLAPGETIKTGGEPGRTTQLPGQFKPKPPLVPPPIKPPITPGVKPAVTGLSKEGDIVAFEAPVGAEAGGKVIKVSAKPRLTPKVKRKLERAGVVPPTELGAVGAPETYIRLGGTVKKGAKVVGKISEKITPDFLKQARKRIKSPAGQDAVKMIEQADNVQHSKYEGPWSEKMREAGIRGIKKESEGVRIGEELQKSTTNDPIAMGLRKLLDEMQQTAERKGVRIAYRKGYLPRRLKTEVREKLFDESVKIIDELKATSLSDRAVKAALQHRSDFLKEAVEHLMKEKGQSYKSAINSINFLSRQEIFRKTAAEHRRTQFLPSHFYETDVRKIIPEYVREISQRIAQVEVFGRNAEKWSKKMQEVMDVDFKESQMLQDLVDMWSGDIVAERGYKGTARKVQNLYYGFEMSTKIGMGTAAIPNITQPLISSMPAAGVWRSIKGGYQTLLKTGRKRARVSGALNHAALLTFGGVEPTGVMAKITKYAPMMKPFKAINRFNQYLSATTYEVLVKDLHKIANKPGVRQKWARAKLEKFDVDPTKPLTQEKVSEGMYRFATDEQLQRNVLDDPYMFNLPKVKPFVLFKRFGYRQFVKTKNNLKWELSHGNVFPLVRLLMGGIAGGEGVIFAKNKLKSWLTGEPVYREEDWGDWERYVNDIAAVGSFGVVSDIMDISKVSDLWSGLKFTVTPVPVADIEQIYKTGEKIFKDLDKREIGDVIRRQSPELLNLTGSLPRWTKQRLRTEGQKRQRARFFRGRKRTEILDLMLRGEGNKAGHLINLWNKNHPTNPLGSDDINWTELKNRAKARVRLGYRK